MATTTDADQINQALFHRLYLGDGAISGHEPTPLLQHNPWPGQTP